MDRLIVSLLCLFDFFDGSFSVIQPKAISAYNNIAFKDFELSNEKISRQNVSFGSFSVIQPKAISAYKNMAFEFFEPPNKKISRQYIGFFFRYTAPKLPCDIHIGAGILELFNEKISRQNYRGATKFLQKNNTIPRQCKVKMKE